LKTYTLDNGILKAVFLSYGAILHQLWVKDKNGEQVNVIQGLESPKDYLTDTWSRGAIIGRYAGRLENPIQIEGKKIPIDHQNGVLLHGGQNGWSTQPWKVEHNAKPNSFQFTYHCPDGTAGFPGNVRTQICYQLKDNQLCINYQATTDTPTHINLTNHAYFNLNGNSPIDNHQLQIYADRVLELKNTLVPTGKMISVKNTAFDYRRKKNIGQHRLDDYFVINSTKREVASLYLPASGIEMKTYTNQPGVVVFTPPHFDAICFETQKFSNAPNIPSFPSTLLRPEAVYEQKTKYVFSLKNEL